MDPPLCSLDVCLKAFLERVGPLVEVEAVALRVWRAVAGEEADLAANVAELGHLALEAPHAAAVDGLVDLVGELGLTLLFLLDGNNDSLTGVVAEETLNPLDLLLESRVLGLDAVVS